MSEYGRNATDISCMVTFLINGVSHQAWYEGSWNGVETRCGLSTISTRADDMKLPVHQPVNCMLCLDAIAETTAWEARRREKHRRGILEWP